MTFFHSQRLAIRAILCVFLLGGVVGTASEAIAFMCHSTSNQAALGASRIKFRTNLNTYPIYGLGVNQVAYAINQATDIWNEQGDSGYWQSISSSSRTDIPVNLGDCVLLGIDFSLIMTDFHFNDNLGTEMPRCIDGAGNKYASKIVSWTTFYNAKTFTYSYINWGVGDVESDEFDLVHNWAHELGHAYGIHHPDTDIMAVMQTTAVSQNKGVWISYLSGMCAKA